MVRKVVWTSVVDKVFTGILEFYVERNNSKAYSKKLNTQINQITRLLAKHPFLGKRTDFNNIRVFVKGDYIIFYCPSHDEIVVYLVWDTRQDPENIEKLLSR